VEIAVRAEPRVVVQVVDVDDERVAILLSDRITHVGRVDIGAVRAAA
jgi:hypothetical protein